MSPRTWLTAACAAAWLVGVAAADRSPAAMADAATRFLAGLTPAQRQQTAFTLDAPQRTQWHFIPTEMFARHGLTLQEMTPPQRTLAHGLLESALSERGFLTARAIMDLETVLRALETDGRFVRDPERYFFSVFGAPAARGTWGWRVEGHHLSLNITVVNGSAVAAAPLFLGSNPAEVREGPQAGLRVLGRYEDSGRALLVALDPAQRTQATLSDAAPNDIVTMNRLDIEPLTPAGVPASAMTAAQRAILMQVIDAWVSVMAPDIAADRMAALRAAGLDAITFAWAGSAERGARHYYRVQGPTFLIEFDNTQNNANHVHAVWRDFNGDFGRDLLREHIAAAH